MAGALAPAFWFQFLDDAGIPVSGTKLYFYLSGTLTPAPVYKNSDLSTAWAFPAVADSAGRIVVYLDPSVGNLKLIVTDSLDVPFGPTVDPIAPTNANMDALGDIFVFCANSASLVTATTYPSGATFDKLQPGSSVWSVDSASLSGTYVLEVVGVQNVAGTLTVALVNLSDAPDVPIATATITSLTGERAVSGVITFPAGGTAKLYGIKSKTSANSSFVIGARCSRTV
jgi:hypothetical protein